MSHEPRPGCCSANQPLSRTLQRTRQMFHDDLLVRSSSVYVRTPKGLRRLRELETSLPRLDRLPSASDLDPTKIV
jgi:DNA-binding transcriptional LysR family regulator